MLLQITCWTALMPEEARDDARDKISKVIRAVKEHRIRWDRNLMVLSWFVAEHWVWRAPKKYSGHRQG
jgi:hypothetical protein